MFGNILIIIVFIFAIIWFVYEKINLINNQKNCSTNKFNNEYTVVETDTIEIISSTTTCEREEIMNNFLSSEEQKTRLEEKNPIEKKITFLHEKVIQLNQISRELEEAFPEKSFKLDGIIVGNIVEILTAYSYGMNLYRQSEKTHDGEVNGVKVQIKGTQSNKRILIGEKPEHLLVEYLNTDTGEIEEIYNGPGELVWKYVTPISTTQNGITVMKLIALDKQVSEEARLKPILPIRKYRQEDTLDFEYSHQQESHAGKTTSIGYTNRNNQTNKGCLHKPGTHANQTAYLLHCNNCGYEYETNGCDIAIRKCPYCQ